MQNLSAQKGFIANPLLIIGAVVIGIVVLLIATGSFKFSGSFKVDDSKDIQTNKQVETEPEVTPKPTPAVTLNDEPYTNSILKFSIKYPKGWEAKVQDSSVNIILPSKTKGADKADALINITSLTAGQYKDTKLSTIGDLQKINIKKEFGNAQISGEKETKIADYDAYEIEFTGTLSGESIHAKYYIISSGSDLFYNIIILSVENIWDENQANFQASLETFKEL